jgi:hypothetical protein
VTEFNYLGVTFTKNGKFKLAKQKNIEKATKAMYEVIRRIRYGRQLGSFSSK